jgi:two-component system chemotaxis sensor kinase CheA
LVHLVRNAVDHGIEPIEERAEKSPEGKLTLEVQRDERTLHVTVTDDGRGIDETRVVAKAVGMGVLTDEDASRLPVEERLALVFVDGLSTANDVTDVSGRGVGVAATKAAVEAVGGKIQLRSRVGIGTTFSVTLPLESGAPENDEAHFAKSAS